MNFISMPYAEGFLKVVRVVRKGCTVGQQDIGPRGIARRGMPHKPS